MSVGREDATLTPIGIVGMSRFVEFVSFVLRCALDDSVDAGALQRQCGELRQTRESGYAIMPAFLAEMNKAWSLHRDIFPI